MFYLALVNETKGTLTVNPDIAEIDGGCGVGPDQESARARFECMGLQAEINNMGRNPNAPKGDVWSAYMGDKPWEAPNA